MKFRIYVAGPISKGKAWPVNLRDGIDAGHQLWKHGLFPYIPHLNFLWEFAYPEICNLETMLEIDLAFLEVCDALLRLPGESAGADREEAFAVEHGIPVYYSIEALLKDMEEL